MRVVDSLETITKIVTETTEKQAQYIDALLSGKYTRLLFGGGVGGGKTVGSLLSLYTLCKMFPGSRWGIVRKDRPTLKRTTLPSFWKTCPMPFFSPERFNRSELVATASNGSRIEFIPESYSEDPELHRFDGLELNGFLLEEANELQMDTYLKCIERSGRWKINPMPLPYLLLTCNPHQGFLKDIFFTPWEKGELKAPYFFVRSLVTDNPHHAKEYIQNLQEIKKRAPALYRRLIEGSWDSEDMAEQLVSWEWLYNAEPEIDVFADCTSDDHILSLGVDVGRHGKDKSVWTLLEGSHKNGANIKEIFSQDKTDQKEVFDITKRMIIEHGVEHDRVWMDVVGLGGGAFDFLQNDGFYIQEIVGGSKAVDQSAAGGFKFFNLNTQLGWNTKLWLEDSKIGNLVNSELRSDLAAQGYGSHGEKSIRLWSKDKVKEKIKRSPDLGDSFKYALWGFIYDTIEPLPSFIVV